MSAAGSLYKTDQESGLVELYDVDLTIFGGSIYHFTPSTQYGSTCVFGGTTYSPFPIAFGEFETSTSQLPRPTLTVGRVENKILYAALNTYGDLVGMTVKRRKTYEKYLDTGSSPDSTAHTFWETFIAIQLAQNIKSSLTWVLATPIDLPNTIIPGKQYLKDPSTHNVYAPGLSRIMSM